MKTCGRLHSFLQPDEMEPMDFPPVHFVAPRCVECAVDRFVASGEFIRWLLTIEEVAHMPEADARFMDEWHFWNDWFADLRDAAFEERP